MTPPLPEDRSVSSHLLSLAPPPNPLVVMVLYLQMRQAARRWNGGHDPPIGSFVAQFAGHYLAREAWEAGSLLLADIDAGRFP